MAPAAIELIDVHLRRARRAVLRGVTLTLPAGSRTALLGPSNSGAEDLLQVVQGIARPTRGQVRVAGCPANRGVSVRRGIGYVPAAPAWYPHLSCAGVGEFLGGLYPSWDRERFVELLARFGVPSRARAETLTPGVKARLALAAALAPAPPLVLVELDPVLDDVERERLLVALDQELSSGATLVLASQRLAGLAERTERVAIMAHGQLRFAGAHADLLARLRRLQVQAAEPPEVPAGVRVVAWRPLGGRGELTVEVETPEQLVALEALTHVDALDWLDLDQAYQALAWPPAAPPRQRVPRLSPPGTLPEAPREVPS